MNGLRAGEQLTLTASVYVAPKYVERLVTFAIEHGIDVEAPFVLPDRPEDSEQVTELRAAYNANPPNSRETWLGIDHFKYMGSVLLGYGMAQCSEAFKSIVFPIRKDNSKKQHFGAPINRADINLVVSTRKDQGYPASRSQRPTNNSHSLKPHKERIYAKAFGPEDPNELLVQTGSFIDLSLNSETLDTLHGIKRQVRSIILGMTETISAKIAENSPGELTS